MKKLQNTFNPFLAARPSFLFGANNIIQRRLTFLDIVVLALAVCMWLCVPYLCWLLWQRDMNVATDWLMSAALLGNAALGMAFSSRIQPSNKKHAHRFWSGFNITFTMYFAAVLLPVNPWLVCASLVLCILLFVYLRITVCLAYDTYPATRLLSDKRAEMASYALSACAIVAAFYAPWLVVAMHGLVVYVHEQQFWNNRRIDNPLSHDQHIDYWTRNFNTITSTPRTWREMQSYIREYGSIPHSALKTIFTQLNVSILLQYFDELFTPEAGTHALTQAIQEHLSLLDVRAAAVFDLYGDNKKEAALCIKDFINVLQQEPELFELPDLQA